MKIYQLKFEKWLGMDYYRLLAPFMVMPRLHITKDIEWYIIVKNIAKYELNYELNSLGHKKYFVDFLTKELRQVQEKI